MKPNPVSDFAALVRARTPLLWIVTREEARVEKQLIEVAKRLDYEPRTWDASQGVCDWVGNPVLSYAQDKGPDAALSAILAASKGGTRGVWIMRDLAPWLSGPIGMVTGRAMRNLARALPDAPVPNAQSVVVLSTGGEIPPELACHATVINWPLPTREDIAEALDASLDMLPDNLQADAVPNGMRDACVDAAVGLTVSEALQCYAKSLVQTKRIDPATVSNEKRRVVERDGLLQWLDPIEGGLAQVGGLENVKSWLELRKSAFTPAARLYGIPSPRGIVVVGISGCGKTLLAQCLSTSWLCPLIKLDLGAMKSKFVGESERNLRKAFDTIAALGKCVVLIDELEKAMQGATQDNADGGVSSDALGALLSWMQDRQGEAFVVATSNDISKLPPELLRKGRFDDIFWVDLPSHAEREAILAASLRKYKRPLDGLDLNAVAKVTDKFTGAELASLIPDAMFAAFNDGARELTTDDLLAARLTVVPLCQTAPEKIAALRQWAVGKARPASAALEARQRPSSGKLDLE
jgi:AAA+ superfamily predicted ATPase